MRVDVSTTKAYGIGLPGCGNSEKLV